MLLEHFKIIHLAGLMMLFLGLGGLLALQGNGNKPSRRLVMIFHGVGLALLFIGGFGMLGIGKIGFTGPIIAKMVIWLLLGAILVLGKRRIFSPGTVWTIALVLGMIAAYLGVALRTPL